MNKKLISFAIAGILAGGVSVAQAGDVTVFGNVNVSIDSIDQDTGRGGVDDVTMESNTSSFGVKGSEDLGNGLQAIFLVEFQFQADEQGGATGGNGNGGSVSDRDQWVGLKGGFGQVRFGTISTSYKSHGAMLDPIYRTSLENRSNGLQSRLHSGANGTRGGRLNNHIRFDSADYSGVKITVDYALDQMADEEDTWGIGGQYKNGGILVFADYITDGSSPTAAGTDDDAWKVGGSFQVNDMFAVYAQYEDGALLTATMNEDANQWLLGGSATMGGTTLYLGFGQAEDQGAVGANWEQDSITLAVDHKLSKRTDIYGGWAQTDIDGSGEEDLISVGLRHKF